MKGKQLPPVLLLAVSLLALIGCSPSLVETDPKLPPGFLDTPVPNVNLNAYLYLSQEAPTTVPLGLLVNVEALSPGSPDAIQIDHMAAFMGPDMQAFGAILGFGTDADARFVWQQVEGPLKQEVTGQQDGADIRLVRGSSLWTQSLTDALSNQDTSAFPEGRPDVWKLMRLFPASPPGQPVAAGFVRPNRVIIDSLAARAGLDLGSLSQALGTVNISNVAFATYSNNPIEIPAQMTPKYVQQYQVGTIFVARSSYPGFILSFFLNNFSGRMNLEDATVSGERVLYREFRDLHLFFKAIGNTIFFTLAPDRDFSERLMASVLDVQNG